MMRPFKFGVAEKLVQDNNGYRGSPLQDVVSVIARRCKQSDQRDCQCVSPQPVRNVDFAQALGPACTGRDCSRTGFALELVSGNVRNAASEPASDAFAAGTNSVSGSRSAT